MGIEFSKNRFEELENDPNNLDSILDIFDQYDVDRSGILEGFEFSNFIESLAQYLYQSRFEETDIPVTLSQLRLLVKKQMDTNRDGKYQRDEVCDNLAKIFKTVDLYIKQHNSGK